MTTGSATSWNWLGSVKECDKFCCRRNVVLIKCGWGRSPTHFDLEYLKKKHKKYENLKNYFIILYTVVHVIQLSQNYI